MLIPHLPKVKTMAKVSYTFNKNTIHNTKKQIKRNKISITKQGSLKKILQRIKSPINKICGRSQVSFPGGGGDSKGGALP